MDPFPIEFRTAWRSLVTRSGQHFDYQYDGNCPTVRAGRYEAARDYMFLLMDRKRQLYRIPVRVSEEALSLARSQGAGEEALVRAIEQHFCRVLEADFQPRNNFPYDEMDRLFALDAEAMAELLLA